MDVATMNTLIEEKNQKMKKDLFTPYQLGKIKLSHRIVMAPMTRCRAINSMPNENLEEYYTQRSTFGGLLITEGTLISPVDERYSKKDDVKGHQRLFFALGLYVPDHCPGIYTEQQVNAWKKVVDSVHAKGAIIFCQLWHVGSHFSNQGASLSSMVDAKLGNRSPQHLIIEHFRQAALNAIHAGFDGVEIHAADGYLIDQYHKMSLNHHSETCNNKTSLEDITNFVMKVVQVVVETIGAEKVGVRISPAIDYYEATEFNLIDLGLAIIEGINKLQSKFASKLAYVHATRPNKLGQGVVEQAKGDAQPLKKLRDAYEGTFMSSGGYNKNQGMEAVAQGEADLVAYGRAFISNPDLVQRFKIDNAPMNKYVRETFYAHNPLGYTDYPSLEKETIMSY